MIDLTLTSAAAGEADPEAEVRFAALGCLKALRRRMADDGWPTYRFGDIEEAIERMRDDRDRQVRELAGS